MFTDTAVLNFPFCSQASQIALALLGLTYNVIPAETFAVTKVGLVSIPDLSDIQSDKVLAKSLATTQVLNARRYSANR